MTKTTTRRVIQTQNYTAPNGIDEYAIPMKPGINDSAFSPGAHFQNGPRMSDSIDPGNFPPPSHAIIINVYRKCVESSYRGCAIFSGA